MHSGRFVFSQVMQHLPSKAFRRCVRRYRRDRHIQSFTCMDRFLCLAFAQLTHGESLRDIEVCLRAHREKLYHMWIRGGMARNTLANHVAVPANTVAELYRHRWQVELFFKWIKLHLRIKSIFGTSENAVKTQLWNAVAAYALVAIVKNRLNAPADLYTIYRF